jgi:hypothetical protein
MQRLCAVNAAGYSLLHTIDGVLLLVSDRSIMHCKQATYTHTAKTAHCEALCDSVTLPPAGVASCLVIVQEIALVSVVVVHAPASTKSPDSARHYKGL